MNFGRVGGNCEFLILNALITGLIGHAEGPIQLVMIKIIFTTGFFLLSTCLAAQLKRDIQQSASEARALVGV